MQSVSGCRGCGANIAINDQRCAECGAAVSERADGSVAAADPVQRAARSGASDAGREAISALVRAEAAQRLRVAPRTLFLGSLLVLAVGLASYWLGRHRLEHELEMLAVRDLMTLDRMTMRDTGRTWVEELAHIGSGLRLQLVIYLALAALYLGMSLWAKRDALAATVTALVLFATTLMIFSLLSLPIASNATAMGLLAVALVMAISACYEARELRARL
jgi:hypothetical protein